MNTPIPLHQLPQENIFHSGDVFVLFGELFGRGYANGLVNEARQAGMQIIGITVGRRDAGNTLRPLNEEELATAEQNLGGKIINVPLMAGFDADAPVGEPTPTDLLGSLTLKSWTEDKLDWTHIEKSRLVQGNRAVWEGTGEGHPKGSSKVVKLPIVFIFDFDPQGKARETRVYVDVHLIGEQLK